MRWTASRSAVDRSESAKEVGGAVARTQRERLEITGAEADHVGTEVAATRPHLVDETGQDLAAFTLNLFEPRQVDHDASSRAARSFIENACQQLLGRKPVEGGESAEAFEGEHPLGALVAGKGGDPEPSAAGFLDVPKGETPRPPSFA